jgi:hypothetical protein
MDYHLRPIGKTCAVTGGPLVPGTRCHSVLVEREGELARLDIADEAWAGPPEGTIGHWVTLVPQPTSSRPKPLDADALMTCFEQMCDDASPANEKFRYILALLLLQRRKLQLTGGREENEDQYLEVTGARGEGPWEVRDQRLDEAEIEQLQAALTAQLSVEEAAA